VTSDQALSATLASLNPILTLTLPLKILW
jgi:hypothetical protein